MESRILREPHKLLHGSCNRVTEFDEARKVANELLTTIKHHSKWWNRWLGFAANQIGYSLRIIVLRNGKDTYKILINPEIIEKKFPFIYPEQCYSLKGVYFVKRYLWSKVKYQDVKGG